LVVINPEAAKRFAEAIKTDAVDARAPSSPGNARMP